MPFSTTFLEQLATDLGPYWWGQCHPFISSLSESFSDRLPSLLHSCFRQIRSKTDNQTVVGTFIYHYLRYLSGDTGKLAWEELTLLTPADMPTATALEPMHTELGIDAANRVGILKLNGGLGTTMGCTGAKSSIKILPNKTFLDVIAEQVLHLRSFYKARFPLILMNSFNTSNDARTILNRKLPFIELIQHEFPRINDESKFPFIHPNDPIQNWAPPGHGDVLLSLMSSGTAKALVREGIDYLLISNADNLAPTFDPAILGYMIANHLDFLSEVTPKTAMDTKGGTIVKVNQKLTLLERSQVDEAHVSQFEDPSTCTIFNTNTLWVSLPALISYYKEAPFHLPLIVNHKTLDGVPIVQLETAVGSAISQFERSGILVVDRNRFLPVKKTSDLLVILSDLVQPDATQNTLVFNRHFDANAYPDIRFDEPLSRVSEFHDTFKSIPSLKNLVSLSVEGRFTFGPNVSFSGKVVFHSESNERILFEKHHFDSVHVQVTSQGQVIQTPL